MTPLARARNAVLNVRYPGMTFAETFGAELRAALPAIDEADQIARAVLEAIREPSEGMKNVGLVVSRRCVNEVDGEALISGTIGETIWTAMIDTALSEGG